jgi:Tub family
MFIEDQLLQALLKGKYMLRITSPQQLQLLDPDSGHKVYMDSSILKEANRMVKRDLDRRFYSLVGGDGTTTGFTIAKVTLEQQFGSQDSLEFDIRKFKFQIVGQSTPALVGIQRHNKCSEILIFEGTVYQPDSGYEENSEGYLGKIEFGGTGLKYRALTAGLSANNLSLMPDGSFVESKPLVGLIGNI